MSLQGTEEGEDALILFYRVASKSGGSKARDAITRAFRGVALRIFDANASKPLRVEDAPALWQAWRSSSSSSAPRYLVVWANCESRAQNLVSTQQRTELRKKLVRTRPSLFSSLRG